MAPRWYIFMATFGRDRSHHIVSLSRFGGNAKAGDVDGACETPIAIPFSFIGTDGDNGIHEVQYALLVAL